MSTLNKNIHQAIQDFDSIQQAIIDKGVEVPSDTPTREYDEKIREIETGITPSGTLNITENGEYDVTEYASAEVDVPQPSGKINITENGTDIDVARYAKANVNVSEGKYDIETDFEIVDGHLKIAKTEVNGDYVVYIPNNVTSINGYAFNGNEFINAVEMNDNVLSIHSVYGPPKGCFIDCINLHRIKLSTSIANIPRYCFANCDLDEINIENINSIGEYGFASNSRLNVDVSNIEEFGEGAFSGTNLSSVALTKATDIGKRAFAQNGHIDTVYLPNTLSSVGYEIFYSSNINSITIDSEYVLNNVGITLKDCNINTVNLGEHVTSKFQVYNNAYYAEGTISGIDVHYIPYYQLLLCPKNSTTYKIIFHENTYVIGQYSIPTTINKIVMENHSYNFMDNSIGDSNIPIDIYYKGSSSDWNTNVTVGGNGNARMTYANMHYDCTGDGSEL